MFVTFIELTIGMLVLGIPNPLAVAAIILLLHITSLRYCSETWAIIGFVFNNYKIGIGMIFCIWLLQ